MKVFRMMWLLAAVCLLCGCAAAPVPSEAPAAETAPAMPEEPAAEAAPLTSGTVTGGTYENTALGYGCTLEGWTFADEMTLRALNDREDGDAHLDMSAASENGVQTVQVLFMEADGAEAAEPERMTEEYAEAGYEKVQVRRDTAVLAGDSYPCIVLTAEIEGVPITETHLLIPCGGRTAVITATAYLDAPTDEILGKFYKL